MRFLFALTALLAASSPAAAEVVSASSNGFHLRQTVNLVVPPEIAFPAFGNVAAWWDENHTYSGDSANMRLSLTPGGCFCERLPDGGGIEHMRVAYIDPGKRVVLTGSLGPLLYEATSGVMDVQVKMQSAGAQLVLDYKVAGFANGGADTMAPLVDKVLAEQMRRFRAFATTRPRT